MTDVQAGHEKTITGLLPALAGANSIYGMGMLDMGMTLSFQQFIIDDEIARMILRVVRGFEVSYDHLALEVIKKVGIGGHYLVEDHTLRHFKTETVETKLFHRENYEGWLSSGKREIKEIASEKVKNILASHVPDPLPEGMDTEFEKIIKSMEE